jgi:hypothetical protein
VIFKILVRFGSHINIEPHDLLIIRSQDKVIPLWMDRDRRDPLGPRLVLGDHGLFLKIVLEHLNMSSSEEMRLRWMEANCLNDTFRLGEWPRRVAS